MKPKSAHEEHKQHFFDGYCKRVLKNEALDIQRPNQRCQNRQSSLSEHSEIEVNQIYTMDEYARDYYIFKLMEYDVILLSYFLGYNDKEIAGLLELMQYTEKYHRRTALKDLKERLEG